MSKESDELRGTLCNTVCNASNYAKRAQPYLLGSDMSDVLDKTAATLLAAGYRKQEVVIEWGAAHANGIVARTYRTDKAALAFVKSMAEVGHEMKVLRREYRPATYTEWEAAT